ncbi:MAG: hypothetical protein CBD98_003915 [Flavobacteriaceae bacterium TMED238]|nr:MAG: hypothetical protein CBD98_003915 [Flavobacteriaceae bacterium TMED238]
MTKTTLHSDFFLKEVTQELKEVISDELLNQEVVIQNKNLVNNMIETLKNYDSNYWSIYYADDFKTIVFQIGEYIVSKIGSGYLSIVVDGIFFDTKDLRYLLQTLKKEQKNIFEDHFNEEFLNLHIYTNISNEEEDLISSAQNIVLSKVFGDTYQEPEHKDDESLLKYFKVEKTQDTNISPKKIIDEKFLKLLSGETSTLEYKETMFDEPNRGTKILGHIMFDEVIRAIAGFANSITGGSLLVGVHDLQIDSKTNLHIVTNDFYKIVEKQFGSEDKFLLRFGDTLKKVFQMPLLATITINFLEIEQSDGIKKFLHIFVPAFTQPTFIKFTNTNHQLNPDGTGSEIFFVRVGYNSTEKLSFKETIEYLVYRFPNYIQSLTS